jgi:hypothetical protein
MAATIVQDTKSTNGLAQTLTITFSSGPTEGNLLLCWTWHDETADLVSMSSSGWTRMARVVATLSGFDYRITLWAKFAGASESTTITVDLGEVNRRAHGYGVEISSSGITELNAADSAAFVSGDAGGSAGTSNQVDDELEVQTGQLAVCMVGLNQTSAVTPDWATEITRHESWSNNFKASAVGYADPPGTLQPTATWGTSRHSLQMLVALGTPPAVSKVLAGSTFRAAKVSA